MEMTIIMGTMAIRITFTMLDIGNAKNTMLWRIQGYVRTEQIGFAAVVTMRIWKSSDDNKIEDEKQSAFLHGSDAIHKLFYLFLQKTSLKDINL